MTAQDLPAELAAYLGHPALTDFWSRVRRGLERTGGSLAGSVAVDLDDDTSHRVSGLLGRTIRPGRRRLRLAELDAALRTSAAERGVLAVVAAVTGSPLRDRPGERAGRTAAWETVWTALDAALVEHGLAGADWSAAWAAWLRRGVLTRAGADSSRAALRVAVAALHEVMGQSDAVHDDRPGGGRQLGELATAVAGDAHALDGDRLAGLLVVRALAAARDLPVPVTAADRRAVWAAAGIGTDSVSGSALVWNLRPPGADRWSAMMRERADLGLVTALTVSELRRAEVASLHDDVVHGVENPQVLQAATVVPSSAALVCFSGNPSVAGWALARALGDQLRYHGDFDWPGVAIAGRLYCVGVRPWRMSGEDYLSAVSSSHAELPLTGRPVATPWDPSLATAMIRAGVAVHEEALTSVLLGDLR